MAHSSPLTNSTLETIARDLRSAQRVLILTHAKPDGDAVGSTLAVARALNTIKPGCTMCWYFGPNPMWLRDISGPTAVQLFEPPTQAPSMADFDRILVTDTTSLKQVEPMVVALRDARDRVSVVDHHVQGDEAVAAQRYVDVSAAAVCQPVAKLCSLILGCEIAKLPPQVAEACYLGLATDTGWFRHSNVNRSVMALAGELLDAGANHVRLYTTIEQRETPGRLRLIGKALATIDLRLQDRLAFLHLTLDDMRAAGAMPGETGGLTDFTQTLATTVVSALITEVPSEHRTGDTSRPLVKISLRSKSEPVGVDVNRVAQSMGGGGHVRAAGAKLHGTIDDAKREIERLVSEQLS
jgi:phosphoesterase RecJ-like protein